jgi:hypothetical protein
MTSKVERIGAIPEKVEEKPVLALNDQVSQDLLAVRLLLTLAQEVEDNRLELIRRCNRYVGFALEDLRKLRESTNEDVQGK